MKYLIALIIISFFNTAFAKDKEIKYIESDKLKIVGGMLKSNPNNWLQSYGVKKKTFGKDVRITAIFDIKNVKEVTITDMNAANKYCRVAYPIHLVTLFLDPKDNIKSLGVLIHMPCFVELYAMFKLTVITSDNKYYTNTVGVLVNTGAFSEYWSSGSED